MAKILKGILGGIQGTIGDVNGYYYKGVPVIRAKRKKSTKEITSEKQLASLQRMKLANAFLGSMVDFVNVSFGLTEIGQRSNGYNAVKSHITKTAFVGTYPEQVLDYTKILIAEGQLDPAVNPQAVVVDDGIKFTWETNAEWLYQEANSNVMLLVYAPGINKVQYMLSGSHRTTGQQFLPVKEDFRGQTVHCYIAFIAEDRKSISKSAYVCDLPF